MPLFGKKKEKKKAYYPEARKPPSPESPQHYGGAEGRTSGPGSVSPRLSPSGSMQNLGISRSNKDSALRTVMGRGNEHSGSVKDKVAHYEQKESPEKKKKGVSGSYASLDSRERSVTSPPPSASTSQHGSYGSLLRPETHSQAGSSHSSVASPAPEQVAASPTTTTTTTTTTTYPTSYGFESPPAVVTMSPTEVRGKSFEGHHLPLPPLQMATVQHRQVRAEKSQQNGGGFGFILRQSYLPVPDDPGKTRLVHLVEPRPDYTGSLMTGDRIVEVNGWQVEDETHERVVELIKASGDSVELLVASMPELRELNSRVFQGSDNPFANRGNKLRKSGKMKPGQTGTLRKQGAKAKKEFKVG